MLAVVESQPSSGWQRARCGRLTQVNRDQRRGLQGYLSAYKTLQVSIRIGRLATNASRR